MSTIVARIVLLCAALLPTLAWAECKNIPGIWAKFKEPQSGLLTANQNLAQMLASSGKSSNELAAAQIVALTVEGTQVDLIGLTLLLGLHLQMKLPADAKAIADQVNRSVPNSVKRLNLTIQTLNGFIPTFTNQAFVQQVVVVRDQAAKVARVLQEACEA